MAMFFVILHSYSSCHSQYTLYIGGLFFVSPVRTHVIYCSEGMSKCKLTLDNYQTISRITLRKDHFFTRKRVLIWSFMLDNFKL